jgi:hypothetical protein
MKENLILRAHRNGKKKKNNIKITCSGIQNVDDCT